MHARIDRLALCFHGHAALASGMTSPYDMFERAFATLPELLATHALERGSRRALVSDTVVLTHRELDQLTGRIAAALRRNGAARGAGRGTDAALIELDRRLERELVELTPARKSRQAVK